MTVEPGEPCPACSVDQVQGVDGNFSVHCGFCDARFLTDKGARFYIDMGIYQRRLKRNLGVGLEAA